jgi:hypothetical protein
MMEGYIVVADKAQKQIITPITFLKSRGRIS